MVIIFWKLYDVLGKTLENGEIENLIKISTAEDNKGFIPEAYSSVCTELLKCIDVKYQLVVVEASRGIIRSPYVPTDMMVADIFTKYLNPENSEI